MGSSPKKKLHVGWDLDDVTTNLTEELLRAYNRRFGENATVEQVRDWDFFPPEIHRELISAGYGGLKLKPGSADVLRELKAKGDRISIITYRDPALREETRLWLEENIPGLYDGLFMTAGSKEGVCRQIGVDVLVDDSRRQVQDVSGAGIHSILFSTPMNSDMGESALIHRALGYENVLWWIERLREEIKG